MKDRRLESTGAWTGTFLLDHFPLLLGLFFGVIWSLFYLVMGKLTGMWSMADERFPFLISALLVPHAGSMMPAVSAALAFLDGALVGIMGGVLLRRLIRPKEKG